MEGQRQSERVGGSPRLLESSHGRLSGLITIALQGERPSQEANRSHSEVLPVRQGLSRRVLGTVTDDRPLEVPPRRFQFALVEEGHAARDMSRGGEPLVSLSLGGGEQLVRQLLRRGDVAAGEVEAPQAEEHGEEMRRLPICWHNSRARASVGSSSG